MVINAKGGCGKTTISTTLACYFTGQGYNTALMDYDPQNSSHQWLAMRTAEQPKIHSIDAARSRAGMTRTWQLYTGTETEVVVMDTPAGVTGGQLIDLFNRADTILIPVIPSIIDYNALELFLTELMRFARHRMQGKRIAVVANRVRFKTQIYKKIIELTEKHNIPLIGTLRDTQNYAIAMEAGQGICELKSHASAKDRKQWQSIMGWLHQEIPNKEPTCDSVYSDAPGWKPDAVGLAAS
jgi:chromosome partitioning protein